MTDPAERLRAALSGRYTIQRELGRGGMATVYLARDLKHDRAVALKVLKPELAHALGPERFLREITLTAKLDHPHILPLLDSGEADGFLYYVMPYVEGESLRDRLDREKQLPLEDSLQIAREVADALGYAHSRGIVHRDIKPENILLAGGHARVADFGIARAVSEAGGESLTATGLAVGTPAYMSPEQAAGSKDLDGRSDLYSLGCVLFEMLAGEPPHTGPTAQAIFAKRLSESVPRVSVLRETVPAPIEEALTRVLAKAPADRYRTAAAFTAALRQAPGLLRRSTTTYATGRHGRQAAVGVGILTLVVAGVVVARGLGAPTPAAPLTMRQLTFSGDVVLSAISPDGQRLAYATEKAGEAHVLVRDIAGGKPDTLTILVAAYTLGWSLDGSRLLVGGQSEAVILSRVGGASRRIELAGTFPAFVQAHWLPDGAHVSLHKRLDRRILIVNVESGDTVPVPVGGRYLVLYEGAWSPDGRLFAVPTVAADYRTWAVRLATRDGRTATLVEDSVPLHSPSWSSGGNVLFYVRDDRSLWRVNVSLRTGRRRGRPSEVHPRVDAFGRQTSLTRDGERLVYSRGAEFSNLAKVARNGTDQAARAEWLTRGTALRWFPAVSPDGRWIAFTQAGHEGVELFQIPMHGGDVVAITQGARGVPETPIAWSPEGDRIAFTSLRGGLPQVAIVTVSSGLVQVFEHTRVSNEGVVWAPNAWIAYQALGNRNVRFLNPASGVEHSLAPDTSLGFMFDPQYSPDGSRLAVYVNRGPGQERLWLYDLRDSSFTEITHEPLDRGPYPIGWSPDARYVYVEGATSLFRIDVRRGGTPELHLVPPFRSHECTPAGIRSPGAFICAAFDFHSDAWMIENIDSR